VELRTGTVWDVP